MNTEKHRKAVVKNAESLPIGSYVTKRINKYGVTKRINKYGAIIFTLSVTKRKMDLVKDEERMEP